MSIVNSVLRPVFDAILTPFNGLHPWVSLAVISFLVSIGMLVVFKKTSNQDKITAVKDRITAGLFEIRLFNDDLRAIFRAQGSILRHNATYLGLSLVPLVWMIVPFVLVMAQLQFHYGYQGLRPGDTALLKVELVEGWDATAPLGEDGKPPIVLNVPAGLSLETPPVWISSLDEVAWRLRADDWGDYELGVKLGDTTVTKEVRVAEGIVRRSPERLSAGFVNQLLYPAEPSLPKGGPFRSIHVAYADTGVAAGMPTWLWVFFVLSIVFAFALKDRFGVKI